MQTALREEATLRDDIGYLRARQVRITTNLPQRAIADGEFVGTTPVEINCVPGGLTLFLPASHPASPTERLEGLPNLRVEQISIVEGL